MELLLFVSVILDSSFMVVIGVVIPISSLEEDVCTSGLEFTISVSVILFVVLLISWIEYPEFLK